MDRITHIRIRNVRAFENVELALGQPLTVLIGENGSGKSTIIECLEILRKAAEPGFLQAIYSIHGGLFGLLRKGETELAMGITIEGADQTYRYDFTLAAAGAGAVVKDERLILKDGFAPIYSVPGGVRVYQAASKSAPVIQVDPNTGLALPLYGAADPRIETVRQVLRGIEVHLGFDTTASWLARSYQRPRTIREHTPHAPAERLSVLGQNLASAWAELKNRSTAHWEDTLDTLRLGLGQRVDNVIIQPDPGGGSVYLAVRFRDLAEPIYSWALSDGQLTWLAFVAMTRLNEGRSLLAVDEPELHLHPALLGRVVSELASLPGPVVLATHSDRLLELIEEPVKALRVLSLNGSKAVVSQLDETEFPKWLEHFGDLGQLRASGFLPRALTPASTPSAAAGETAA
jgi:predicted ATPase